MESKVILNSELGSPTPRKRRAEDVEDPKIKQISSMEGSQPDKAVEMYKQLIAQDDATGELARTKEAAILRLAQLYAKLQRPADLKNLVVEIRPFFSTIPKAKTAKIVKQLIDAVGEAGSQDSTLQLQADICQDAIDWCIAGKRTFLKQRIQARLAALYFKMKKYKDALSLLSTLAREVKKFDDKLLLTEVYLVETRVHHALQNVPKAKGALTSARTAANAIYCPPLLQAQIDLQAGIVSAEEKDYKTGFSYFYEAFEGFNTIDHRTEATQSLKYMLLCKIMTNHAEDVFSIINGKSGVKYAGVDVEAMRAVAEAYKKRSIHDFENVFKQYSPQLAGDAIIMSHLDTLKSQLLEQNLMRLLEPFSRVEIAHVAELIRLPLDFVEAKLSEMILDKKLNGILDQGSGDLILFDDVPENKTYKAALETISELNGVVDRLFNKAQLLTA